jgi:CheY-like chemotaxis protein
MARILVIDDDASLLQMVRLMLEREGNQVFLAESGEEGLSAALGQSPDLAIIDLMMPGMSGYSVTRALRADPRTEKLPILILTARGQPMDRQMAIEAGANAHLAKPITAKELVGRVNDILAQSSLTRAPEAAQPTAPGQPGKRSRPIGITDQLSMPPTAGAGVPPVAPAPVQVPAPAAKVQASSALPVVTVIGLRGGSGTTTVAVNLALLLRERRGRVCIVDLNMAGGHVGLHLHMATRQSWGDLLSAGDTPDPRALSSIVVPNPTVGLALLAAPPVPGMRSLSQAAMTSILNTLIGNFQQIVVDADNLNPASAAALLVSQAIVVVMGDDVMAVHTTSHMMQSLQNLGVEMGRVRVAVNRSRPDTGMPSATILKALGRPIAAEIPYDPNQIQAMRRGTPLVMATPDSAFSKSIQQLMRTF